MKICPAHFWNNNEILFCEIFSSGRNCIQICKCRFSKSLWAGVQKKCRKCRFFRLRGNTGCRMSIQSWYFYVQAVEKLWFWMCLRQVSMLCHFCLFLRCVLGVFNDPVGTPACGLLGLRSSLFRRTRASLLCMFVPTSTAPLHYVGLIIWPCHFSYIFVPCLAFRIECCRWWPELKQHRS